MEKPNLVLPLASSYNTRGVQGDTNAKAGTDQRKINCMYDVARNSITGNSALYLVKRPGVSSDNTVGTTTQVPYLVHRTGSSLTAPGSFSGDIVLLVKDAGSLKSVSYTGNTITVIGSTTHLPFYVDETLISNVSNTVIQTGLTSPQATRAFFTTAYTGWTEIVDVDYTGLSKIGKMEHMDGYALQGDATGKLANSDLNSLANWTAGAFVTKQIQQDYPVGLAKFKNQILFFAEQSVEAFYNQGNPTGSPLSPIKQLQRKVGLVGNMDGHYYCVVNDVLFFVGRKAGGYAARNCFAYDGANYVPVSTPFIDKILGEATLYGVYNVGFHGKSAVAIRLTANTMTPQRWLMYFPDWKDWFEWTSPTFFPSSDQEIFPGLSASSKGNSTYRITALDNWQDDGTSYQYATQFKLPSNGNDRKVMASFGVKGDTARSANSLLVEASDDDYQSFKTLGTIDLTKPIKAGTRGGSYIDRCIRLSNTNALETRLQSFVATIK